MTYPVYPPPPDPQWAAGPPTPEAGWPAGSYRSSSQRNPRRIGVIAAIVALVLAVTGGIALSVPAIVKLAGGGTQPEEVLPATAFAFVKIDLNPDAAEKLDAVRFLRAFPDATEHFDEEVDVRQSMWDLSVRDDERLEDIDYDKEVAPWLGDRVGVAVLPPEEGEQEPQVIAAIEVRDEDKARDGLARIADLTDDDSGLVVRDGYALFTEEAEDAERLSAAAERDSLADHDTFVDDLEPLGETGVSSGWIDFDRTREVYLASAEASELSEQERGFVTEQLKGRATYAVRFEAKALEMIVQTHDVPEVEIPEGDGDVGLAALPDTSLGAVGLANGRQLAPPLWDAVLKAARGADGPRDFDSELEEFQSAYGVRLPEDLGVLLGDSFAVAVEAGEPGGQPVRVGARIRTDTARFEELIEIFRTNAAQFGEQPPIEVRTTGEDVVIGSDPAYADTLAAGGDLGSDAGFQAALPDVEEAEFAAYVDVDRAAALLPADTGSAKANLEVVDAFGMTVTSDDDGQAEMRLRIVVK